jgi:hypothetical protein
MPRHHLCARRRGLRDALLWTNYTAPDALEQYGGPRGDWGSWNTGQLRAPQIPARKKNVHRHRARSRGRVGMGMGMFGTVLCAYFSRRGGCIPSSMSQPLHIKHSQARIPLMDPVLYSLGDTISDFFASRAPVTQQQCDDLAVSLVGGPVNPVPIQGSFSYTVTAGSQQIQDCSISRCEFRLGYATS